MSAKQAADDHNRQVINRAVTLLWAHARDNCQSLHSETHCRRIEEVVREAVRSTQEHVALLARHLDAERVRVKKLQNQLKELRESHMPETPDERPLVNWENLASELSQIRERRPRWRDKPTVPGWWIYVHRNIGRALYRVTEQELNDHLPYVVRVYGPIPEDSK